MHRKHDLDSITIAINASPEAVFTLFEENNPFSTSRSVRTLLNLKKIQFPKRLNSPIVQKNFIPVYTRYPHLIIFSITGKFWQMNPHFKNFNSLQDFESFNDPVYSRVYWTLLLVEKGTNHTLIHWNTSVEHFSVLSEKKFTSYWKRVNLLSLLIRKILLFLIKRKIKLLLRRK